MNPRRGSSAVVRAGHWLDSCPMNSPLPTTVLALAGDREAIEHTPYLVVLGPNTCSSVDLALGRTFLIGRAPDCDVRIDEEMVSRTHARLHVRATDLVEVEDLGSANGTW